MIKKIYIFGNPLLDFDSLPIKMAPGLSRLFPALTFEIIDPNENLHPENQTLVVIDTVINATEPFLINDIEMLELSPRYSMHDLDLAFTLKLLKKIGSLKYVYIIGVPPDYEMCLGLENTSKIISNLVNNIPD